VRHIVRGGRYYRAADPGWRDPLDASHAQQRGGRWNPPGSFPVLYLNRDVRTARALVVHRFRGLPYGPELLRPERAPTLIATDLAADPYVDVVTADGCIAAGLPATYPVDDDGRPVPWAPCQAIGRRAWEAGERGIACRSAVPGGNEELAHFARPEGEQLRPVGRWRFDGWFWPATARVSGYRSRS
jgi:RES domain-containing protein